MLIQNKNYDCDYKSRKNPLMIGCSGGGGHISAIQGVREFLAGKYKEVKFTKHAPVLHEDKRTTWTGTNIRVGSAAMNDIYVLSPTLQTLLSYTTLPLLPDRGSLDNEVRQLNDKETKKQSREYIDMLLDIYPAGYESAAIWNVLQRNDRTAELKKLVDLQANSDRENYRDVCREILKLLNNAAINETPYTEIISTQAMSIPALCDTVKKYNETHPDKPQIVIHQYMTDLPTKGAVHFFNALSTLTSVQQQQIKLYGVGMKQDFLDHFFPEGCQFKGVYDIPADKNPMVRAGFKNPVFDNSKKFNVDVTLYLKGNDPVDVVKHEQIASIMLGSQAGQDTVEYIETLLENGINKVFVFGGKNEAISDKIDAILTKHPEYQNKIIRLGEQGDKEITQLMTRSNMVIIRGGGLSVMEQMAMPHNKRQTVLIHHANTEDRELTSGISWEDDNVTSLLANLKQKNVHAEKTSPERAKRQIAEARLIATAKRSGKWTTDEITRYVKELRPAHLDRYICSLKKNNSKRARHLFAYLSDNKANEIKEQEKLDAKAKIIIDSLLIECNDCKHHLINIIATEGTKIPTMSFDIEQANNETESDAFKQASPDFFAAVESYKAVQRLISTLSDENNVRPSQKLRNFKNEYEKREVRAALMYSNDNVVMKFIREINYLLAKIFVFKYMGFDKFFTPEQKVRHQMELITPDDLVLPAYRGPGSE